MKSNEAKTVVTTTIWTALTLILMVAFIASPESWVLALVIVTGMIAGTAGTLAIWEDNFADDEEKAKRQPSVDERAALLMSLLTDEERHQLRHRLMNELEGDGEIVPLADLFRQTERK